MSPRFGGGRGGGGGADRAARSAEAREQARLEREARRAAREGRSPADVPPVPEDSSPADPLLERYAEDPVPVPYAEEPEPVPYAEEPAPEPYAEPAPEPEPFFESPADEPFAAEPAPEPEPPLVIPPRPALSWEQGEAPVPRADPPAAPARRPAPAPARPEVDLPGTDDVPAVRVLGSDADPDRPIGTKRVPASAMASAAGAQGPPRFGAPPRGTPRARRGMRRVVPVVLILLLLLMAYGAHKVWQPFHGDGDTGARVRVVIPDGSGARQIGDQLAKAGVVDSGVIFSLRARFSGDRDRLRSGVHVMHEDMSYGDALKELTIAPKVAPTVQVSIPEGLTIKQMASLAHRAELAGSYTKATRSAAARRTARTLGLPRDGELLEGFLWPATYTLKTTASAADLVAQQLRTFKRETAEVDYAYARRKQLSRYDALIIASLIENEAQIAKERRLIAAVIYNRLKQGIPLQIDATTRYETGNYGESGRPIRQSELDADTPYNTRKKRGLPPTPISSPGLASLKAATRPANVPFIYYVVKPCGNGAHNFSTTDAEFQEDRAAYDRKRAELGGKDPSDC